VENPPGISNPTNNEKVPISGSKIPIKNLINQSKIIPFRHLFTGYQG